MSQDKIRTLINESLDNAEQRWKNGGRVLSTEGYDSNIYNKYDIEESNIPNHPLVSDGEVIIDEYIALVADMRNSSRHLDDDDRDLRFSKVECGIQRVYYETSALLPAIAMTVKSRGGTVTEFLGDGVLALFPCQDMKLNSTIQSYKAAKETVCDTRFTVNEILRDRYNLPEISIGVGLSISKTIINLVGLSKEKQAKAFGKCIFNATKLSTGTNEVLIDRNLNQDLEMHSLAMNYHGHGVGKLQIKDNLQYHSLNLPQKKPWPLY